MFDDDDKVIHAVSESLKTSFGIPSSLANGISANRYDFTVDCILPDIDYKKVENVKNGIGYPFIIETKNLADDFRISSDQDDEA